MDCNGNDSRDYKGCKILAVLALDEYLPYEYRLIEYSDGKREVQWFCHTCGWITDSEPLVFAVQEIENAIKDFDGKYTVALIL